MASRRQRTGARVLTASTLALLVPMQQSLAKSEDVGKPSPFQVVDYNNGTDAWVEANTGDPQVRPAKLDKAERAFEKASAGRSRFPEALLALGLVRFSRNNLAGAETAFREVAAIQKGYLRAEALTYLGLVHLYNHRWSDSRLSFQSALDEKSEEYTAWMGPKGREKLAENYRQRRLTLDSIARVGVALATYQAARTHSGGMDARAVLADIEKLLPEDELARSSQYFNGVDAGLWAFTPPAGEWRYSLRDGLPPDVRPVTPTDLLRSLRIWSAAELGIDPPANLPPVAELTETDRTNLAAGLVKRAMRLEASGNTAEALAAWTRVYQLPAYALVARQHQVYLHLRPLPGGKAPSAASIDAARRIIRGPLADKDPLLYDQQMALVGAIMAGAPASGPGRAPVVELARTESRLVLTGIPGGSPAPASGPVRERAELTLGLLATEASNPDDVNHWRTALNECPARPGRERLRYYLASRQCMAAVNSRQPALLNTALTQANAIAVSGEGGGTQAIPGGADEIVRLRRFLAFRVFELNDSERYRDGVLKDTDFAGEYYAYQAAEQAKALNATVKANPAAAAEAPAKWASIEKLLMDARAHSGNNAVLTGQIDADLKEIRDYRTAVNAFPPELASAWATAANRTNGAMKPADWDAAATTWKGVLTTQLVGRPASERREAALHVVNARLRKADLLRAEGNKEAARLALREARNELSAMPDTVGAHLTDDDKQKVLDRVAANGKALTAGTYLSGGSAEGKIPPYRGARLATPTTQCVIIRYPSTITPSVDRWLVDLRGNANATRRLVDWFNNGPLAQKNPKAKRDFSADPKSPNYLVTFLAQNVSRRPGALVPGTVQWCDHNGKGPWHGTPVKRAGGAAYYLKNGKPIINSVCSNPIGIIPVDISTGSWTEQVESATPPPPPAPMPSIVYTRPTAAPLTGWSERPTFVALSAPSAPAVKTEAPSATILASTRAMSVLALPRCQPYELPKRQASAR